MGSDVGNYDKLFVKWIVNKSSNKSSNKSGNRNDFIRHSLKFYKKASKSDIYLYRNEVEQSLAYGGLFSTLCHEFDFYEAIIFSLLIFKKKDKYFDTFNHSYSEKSSSRAT